MLVIAINMGQSEENGLKIVTFVHQRCVNQKNHVFQARRLGLLLETRFIPPSA